MTHICVSKLNIICSDNGLSPGHWTHRNKLQWNFNRNSNIFIEENTFENVVCEMASICLGLNVLTHEMPTMHGQQHPFSSSVVLGTIIRWIIYRRYLNYDLYFLTCSSKCFTIHKPYTRWMNISNIFASQCILLRNRLACRSSCFRAPLFWCLSVTLFKTHIPQRAWDYEATR